MYTRQQASLLKQEFWTIFGKYISPVLSAEGEKINWINYKTGIRHIAFKMQAGSNAADISIELTHTDPELRDEFFKKFILLKDELHQILSEEWNWEPDKTDEFGKQFSRIGFKLSTVSIFNKEHWPQLISFFKPRIIALDAFWAEYKFVFES